MPQSKLIDALTVLGLPVTVNLPGHQWAHSEEYVCLRYNGRRGLVGLLRGRLASPVARERSQAALALERLDALRDSDLVAAAESLAGEE